MRNSHLCYAGPLGLNPFECVLLMHDVFDDGRVASMNTSMCESLCGCSVECVCGAREFNR